MSTTFFTSDLHLGHRLVSGLRAFSDTADHDAAIAAQWRKQVADDDVVWVLGDVAVSQFPAALELLAGLPGRKHLITGNHDPVHPMHRDAHKHQRSWLSVFDSVQAFGRRKFDGQNVLLSHFPYASFGDGTDRAGSRYGQYRLPDEGLPLLHGHTHGRERGHDRMFHVGWDAWGRLVHQNEVAEWVAGLPKV